MTGGTGKGRASPGSGIEVVSVFRAVPRGLVDDDQLALAGTAHAVSFDLTPPTFAQPQIKVASPLPSYRVVCDGRASLESDLPPGRSRN